MEVTIRDGMPGQMGAVPSDYSEWDVMVIRAYPAVKVPCPKCGEPCGYRFRGSEGDLRMEVICDMCGTTVMDAVFRNGRVSRIISSDGTPYDPRSRVETFRNRLPEEGSVSEIECLCAVSDLCWEHYLIGEDVVHILHDVLCRMSDIHYGDPSVMGTIARTSPVPHRCHPRQSMTSSHTSPNMRMRPPI